MREIGVTQHIDPYLKKNDLRNWNQFVMSVLILNGAKYLTNLCTAVEDHTTTLIYKKQN